MIAGEPHAALERGVAVAALVPSVPKGYVYEARRTPGEQGPFEALERLARFETFTLAGLAARGPSGALHQVYVHSKAMMVDDVWATVGSCNLHAYSLGGHTELNISVWDAGFTQALRHGLFDEHLAQDTRALDDRDALALFRRVVLENRKRCDAGDNNLQGIAVALDASRYAL